MFTIATSVEKKLWCGRKTISVFCLFLRFFMLIFFLKMTFTLLPLKPAAWITNRWQVLYLLPLIDFPVIVQQLLHYRFHRIIVGAEDKKIQYPVSSLICSYSHYLLTTPYICVHWIESAFRIHFHNPQDPPQMTWRQMRSGNFPFHTLLVLKKHRNNMLYVDCIIFE